MKLKTLTTLALTISLSATLLSGCTGSKTPETTTVISTDFSDLVLLTKKTIPANWNLIEQFVIPHRDLEDFKRTLGEGVKEILNQHFEVGESKEILRVNYVYATNEDAARYAMNALKEDPIAHRYLKGDTVVEVISFNEGLVKEVVKLLGLE